MVPARCTAAPIRRPSCVRALHACSPVSAAVRCACAKDVGGCKGVVIRRRVVVHAALRGLTLQVSMPGEDNEEGFSRVLVVHVLESEFHDVTLLAPAS